MEKAEIKRIGDYLKDLEEGLYPLVFWLTGPSCHDRNQCRYEWF
jgi:hypothetical protein